MSRSVKEWQEHINAWAEGKGWNEKVRAFGDECALFHSEISEAYEDFRDHRLVTEIYFEDKAGVKIDDSHHGRHEFDAGRAKPCGIPIELADLMIRLMHFAELHGIDLDAMIEMKMSYNEKRPYRHGGKAT